jgi:hypothetical protein
MGKTGSGAQLLPKQQPFGQEADVALQTAAHTPPAHEPGHMPHCWPPRPQAVESVPARQVPPSWAVQQPLQLTDKHSQPIAVHRVFCGHWPAAPHWQPFGPHRLERSGSQLEHVPPMVAHTPASGSRHWFPSQQPPGQLSAVHSHLPLMQRWFG